MNDTDNGPKLEIDWMRTLAGALAAMSSAVLLSTLGAVGTIIGAAIGSLAATVGTAFYAQGLARSRAAVAKAQAVPRGKGGTAKAPAAPASEPPSSEESRGFLDPDPDEVETGPVGWRDRLRMLPWKRIGIGAGALFVAVMVVILAFELLTGRSVASYTGGADDDRRTTLFRGGGNDDDGDRPPERDPAPEQTAEDPAPTDEATVEPSETVEPTQATTAPTTESTPATEEPTGFEETATDTP